MCYRFDHTCAFFSCSKEWMDAAKLDVRNAYLAKLDVRNAYLDPNIICEASHAGPLLWRDNHPAFTGAKGKAKEKIRQAAHRQAKEEAALYIGKAFLAHQRFKYILAPYHSR